MKTIRRLDYELANAAVALYRAVCLACMPDDRDTDEALADSCITAVMDCIDSFPYCSLETDAEALAQSVYAKLHLDPSKIH